MRAESDPGSESELKTEPQSASATPGADPPSTTQAGSETGVDPTEAPAQPTEAPPETTPDIEVMSGDRPSEAPPQAAPPGPAGGGDAGLTTGFQDPVAPTPSQNPQEVPATATAVEAAPVAAAPVEPRQPEPTTAPGGPAGPPRAHGGPSRAILAILAALGVALVAVGIFVWLTSDESDPKAEAIAGQNRPINQDLGSINAHNSPSLVASPANPSLMVAADRVDRPQLSAAIHVSRDGGETWADAPFPLPPGAVRAFTPDVAFDGRGTLHLLFATLQGDGSANVPSALWLERSNDGGATFSPPVQVAGPYAYQPRLAVDRSGTNVHVTWVQAGPAVIQELSTVQATPAEQERNPGFGPPPNPVVMATSVDGGASFSAPVQVSEPARLRVGAATPVVGPGGEVLVLYEDFGDDVTDFEGRPGPVHQGRFSLVVAGSTDRGRTFTTRSVAEPDVVPAERFLVYLPKFPSMAVDPTSGAVYVTWSDARNRNRDVFVRRSADGGRTWSERVRVNDDDSQRDQYLPQVAVAPDGRVDVLYLDRRQDAGNVLTMASLASSFDEGKTWQSLAVSDALFDSRVGPRNDRITADPGSRVGLVSTSDTASAVWADTRRANPDTDSQDLFFATVRFNPR